MSDGARVDSLDVLRELKVAIIKFAEEVNLALDDADSELQRTLNWLEHEQVAYWNSQVARLTEAVARARDAVHARTMYKELDGRAAAAIDEKRDLTMVTRKLRETEAKAELVKKWAPRLKKEILTYRGAVARLTFDMQSDAPLAIGQLDAMINSLDAYLSLDAPADGAAPGEPGGQDGLAAPEPRIEPQPPAASQE